MPAGYVEPRNAVFPFPPPLEAVTGHGGLAGQVAGRDFWRAGALASVEAALRLAGGEGPAKSGVFTVENVREER